jgi:hypothetical protein
MNVFPHFGVVGSKTSLLKFVTLLNPPHFCLPNFFIWPLNHGEKRPKELASEFSSEGHTDRQTHGKLIYKVGLFYCATKQLSILQFSILQGAGLWIIQGSSMIILLPTSYYLLPTSYFLLLTSYFLLPTSYFPLPTSYFLLPTYHSLLTTSSWAATLLPTSYFLLPTYRSLLTTYYLLLGGDSREKSRGGLCVLRLG